VVCRCSQFEPLRGVFVAVGCTHLVSFVKNHLVCPAKDRSKVSLISRVLRCRERMDPHVVSLEATRGAPPPTPRTSPNPNPDGHCRLLHRRRRRPAAAPHNWCPAFLDLDHRLVPARPSAGVPLAGVSQASSPSPPLLSALVLSSARPTLDLGLGGAAFSVGVGG
jgi:hypothetical protein